jgi:DNA-binding CsgD family transcriptional regulator
MMMRAMEGSESVGSASQEIDVLVGREFELKLLTTLLTGVRSRGAGTLIRGQAGVGKSALLAAATVSAQRMGIRILTVSGVRSEKGLAFAGLHQILRPLLERSDSLPPPQREALLSTFGMDEESEPDSFLVALATLGLLAEESGSAPLLIVVDDAHWLDPSTLEVLGFVARRLSSLPVVLLIATRDGYATRLDEIGLPELRAEPLDTESAGTLLESWDPELGPEFREQVLAAAEGNPLALAELPATVGMRSPGVYGLPELPLLTGRLERAMVERYRDLPWLTRMILLVASVDGEARMSQVITAAALLNENLTVSLDDLTSAVACELVEHDLTHIRFCHPLLPAAIYQAATPAQRQQAHAALAATLIDYPGRRAWHRAACTTIPDEEVAAELERTSLAGTRRETPGITLAAIERAAELTPDMSRRGRRLLRAAELALEFGQRDRASRLLPDISSTHCDSLDLARVYLVREMLEPGFLVGRNALESIVGAAGEANSAGESLAALGVLQAVAMHYWWADAAPEARARVAAATEKVRAPANDLRVLSILSLCDPMSHGAKLIAVASCAKPDEVESETAYLLGTALQVTGAFDLSHRFLLGAILEFREQGRIWLLAQALVQQAWIAVHAGNWNIGEAAAQEAECLARRTHQPMWVSSALTAQAMIAVMRGFGALADPHLGAAEAIVLLLGSSAALCDIQLTRGLLALGEGRYDDAFEHLRRTFDPHDPAHHSFRSFWRIGEFAEAALHSGRTDEAIEPLARAESLAFLSQSPRLQVGLLYARPLLADDAVAESHFHAALAANIAGSPLYRARLLLEYGTWLRRRRKIAQARMPLRSAHEAFVALGVTMWAERARQELRAAREARCHRPEAWAQLTEQEQQIARLAAQGLSNREIAQRLYISHRTVGSHLYHIFPKLEVASRAQLTAIIGDRTPRDVAC